MYYTVPVARPIVAAAGDEGVPYSTCSEAHRLLSTVGDKGVLYSTCSEAYRLLSTIGDEGVPYNNCSEAYRLLQQVKKVYHTAPVARPTHASVGWIRLGRESPRKLAYLRVGGKNDCSVLGHQRMERCL